MLFTDYVYEFLANIQCSYFAGKIEIPENLVWKHLPSQSDKMMSTAKILVTLTAKIFDLSKTLGAANTWLVELAGSTKDMPYLEV